MEGNGRSSREGDSAPATRVVSLLSAATEIVCALGQGDLLVGRSHECDHPPWVRRLPSCTEPKFDVAGSSAEIDRRIREILRDGLSVYRVDPERLARLRPDVVLTQTQCEVCAVSLADLEVAVAGELGPDVDVVSLHPERLEDVWEDIRRVAAALGVRIDGEELVARLQARMKAIAGRVDELEDRPTVACIEWMEPLMVAGNWMPELVEMAGGEDLFGEAGGHSPELEWQRLREADPDVVLVMPCGWDIDRSRQEISALTGRPGWEELAAVQEGRVYLTEGNAYFNRPGPRLMESLEILAEVLHPRAFRFGHRGSGWQPLGAA